jgi:creatinine amidohydrolase
MPTVLLADLTREQIRAVAPTAVAVLPTAAIEQHGPHLTIATDTLVCTTVCHRAAEIAAATTPVLVAPPVHFGSSHHHRPHPGVLSVTSTTFGQVVREVCEGLVLAGFRRLAIVNGHGGNEEAVRLAAREVALVHPVTIAAASYWTIAGRALVEAGLVGTGGFPGHAGAFETSLVMALRPDLVDGAAMPPPRPTAGAPDLEHRPLVIRAGSSLGSGPGYTDDPSRASAERGARILAVITAEVARFLTDLAG